MIIQLHASVTNAAKVNKTASSALQFHRPSNNIDLLSTNTRSILEILKMGQEIEK